MKTPQQIELERLAKSPNIKKLEEYLEKYWNSTSYIYEFELSELDIKYAKYRGWNIERQDNGVEGVNFQEWFLITAVQS